MKPPQFLRYLSSIWTLLFWMGAIFLPLCAVISTAGWGEGGSSDFSSIAFRIAKFTFNQAVISTLISALLGLFLGLGVGKLLIHNPDSKVPVLLSIPFGIPTVVVGMTWITWLGRSGLLSQLGIQSDWIYTSKGIILAHSFLNIPWIGLMVAQARKGIPQEQFEAVKTLGARAFSQFRFITWVHIRWAFAMACAQVMSMCAMSFAIILLLGGGPPVETLETEIFGKFHYGNLDIRGAAICGVWELGITLVPWIWIIWLQSKKKWEIQQKCSYPIKRENVRFYEWSARSIALLFLFPYVMILNRSLIQLGANLAQGEPILSSLLISCHLALKSSLLTVSTALLSILAIRSFHSFSIFGRTLSIFVSSLMILPSGISALVLSLGFWLTYSRWLDPFEGSLWAMVFIQAALFFPIAFRILWPISEGIQMKQLESAISLGASPVKAFWWVEFPRWRGPLLSALSGIAGLSLGEVGAVSFFYSEKLVPLPFLVSRWMEQYRFEESQGVAGLLFLLSLILIVSSFEIGNRIFAYDSMASQSIE